MCPLPAFKSYSAAASDTELASYDAASPFIKTLLDRGYLYQCTNVEELDKLMSTSKIVAYIGFDATAPSLHVGSLVQIMILRHLQKAGHKPIVLLGGGTTKVGDPSGRDTTRQMLENNQIDDNLNSIAQVFHKYLEFGEGSSNALVVNNDEWLSEMNYLSVLREYGPHFSVNRMLTYDSVKSRLEREQPLSFLEFNYTILQSIDFLQLNRNYDVRLQLGGSDQWGNIVSGVELGRRVDQKQLFGLTAPLMTTSDGKKMGKTADGAVWLSDKLLSPYDYWQFWRNTTDADVIRFLKLFTEIPLDQIEGEYASLEGSAINEAKIVLADEATRLLHGEEHLATIKSTSQEIFAASGGGKKGREGLVEVVLSKDDVEEGKSVVELFIELKLRQSKNEVRRLIKEGGGCKSRIRPAAAQNRCRVLVLDPCRINDVFCGVAGARLNGESITDQNMKLSLSHFEDGVAMLSAGKKKHAVVVLASSDE
jgi:tyrosyl-tRNA synthetase